MIAIWLTLRVSLVVSHVLLGDCVESDEYDARRWSLVVPVRFIGIPTFICLRGVCVGLAPIIRGLIQRRLPTDASGR